MAAEAVFCYAGDSAFASGGNRCFLATTNTWSSTATVAASGPSMDAGNRIALGFLPAGRTTVLTPDPARRQTATVHLAALEHPEADGMLAIKIPLTPGAAIPVCAPGSTDTCSTSGNYLTVELREPDGWDRAFTHSAVFVHLNGIRNAKAVSILITDPTGAYGAGASYRNSGITVHVDRIDDMLSGADVTVGY
jgi:hypothetical protein